MGVVFAERFNKSIHDLLKKPVFEKRNSDWISEISSVVKKYNNTIHSSTKLKPANAFKKVNDNKNFSKFQEKRKKLPPQFQLGQLVRSADF